MSSLAPVIIFGLGVLAGFAGLMRLAAGHPKSRLHRRLALAGLVALPLATYTAVMISAPRATGGFWTWYLVGLMMLALPVMGWTVLCGLAYWIGGRKPSRP